MTRAATGRALAAFFALAASSAAAAALTADEVNGATFQPRKERSTQAAASIIKAQALLARQDISPGEIDGLDGENYRKAVSEFRRQHNLPEGEAIDQAAWDALHGDDKAAVVESYTLTKEDAEYPFVDKIPKDYAEQAKMKALGFRTMTEMLAERFHMSEGLIEELNPKATLKAAGETITVVSVAKPAVKGRKVARLEADKTRGLLRALDKDGKIIAAYPASIGSDDTPSPSGEVKVTRIARNPTYAYDPDKNFKQGKNASKLTLPPGPNNPVGAVWIALSKPTYGVHGTPEPSRVSKTDSHGCVRLTNWDALDLAGLVRPGVPLRFIE